MIKFTTKDLEFLTQDEPRYEIIDGELFVTRAPHWQHQKVCSTLNILLGSWSKSTNLGEVVQAPGIIFSDTDNVIPDLVWISKERLSLILDESGHLTAAPELIVEICSKSTEKRDRDLKLKLYSTRGVIEYWIVDWRQKQIEVFRRNNAQLTFIKTLLETDNLTTPLLPDFCYLVEEIFS